MCTVFMILYDLIQKRIAGDLNLSKKKDLNIEHGEEGDIDMVLDEEGKKIEEEESATKAQLELEFKQYRIKVFYICNSLLLIGN